jgi:hypothetical protein
MQEGQKMKYPRECPVFEVLSHGCLCDRGAIGIGIEVSPMKAIHPITGDVTVNGHVGLHIVSGAAPDSTNIHPTERWNAAVIPYADLRPLTPAAREMLAMVRK